MQTGKRDERIGRADASDIVVSDAQHTPGPWRAAHNGTYWQIDSDAHGQIGDACSSKFIFIGGAMKPEEWSEPIAAANARLMASAPELLAALHEGRRAIGDHSAPHDCYATGPLTGDPIRDLVQCPACSFIAMYDAAITKAGG